MKKFFTLPNAITFLRMCVGLYGVYVATVPNRFLEGIIIFLIFGLLPDVLDGWVARTFHQRTRVGEIFDPLADKMLFYAALFALFADVVLWPIGCVLFLCDCVSTVVHFIKKGGAVKSGKYKFFLQNCALMLFLCGKSFSIEYAYILANCVLFCATCFALHSLWMRYSR